MPINYTFSCDKCGKVIPQGILGLNVTVQAIRREDQSKLPQGNFVFCERKCMGEFFEYNVIIVPINN